MKMRTRLVCILVAITAVTYGQDNVLKLATASFFDSENLLKKAGAYDARFFGEVYPFDPGDYLQRGVAKYKEGHFGEAIEDINESLILYPECGPCYHVRGLCEVELEQFTEAKADFLRAIRYEPMLADAHNVLAYLYMYEEKLDSARKALKTGLEYAPGFLSYYYSLGVVELMAGNEGKATRLFKGLLEKDSCFIDAQAMLAGINLYKDNYKQAVQCIENLIRCDSTTAEFYYWESLLNFDRNKFEAGFELLNKAIALDDKAARFYYLRGVAFSESGSYHEAIEDFFRYDELKPKNSSQLFLSYSQQRERDFLQAVRFFSSKRYGVDTAVVSDLEEGLCAFFLRDEQKAREQFEAPLEKQSKGALLCHYFMGLWSEYNSTYEEALEHYALAIELDASTYELYRRRSALLQHLGRRDALIGDYTIMLKIDPSRASIYKSRGMAREAIGDFSKAILDFNQYLKTDATDLDVYFNRGNCYQAIKFYDNAVSDFERVLQERNYDEEAWYKKALCHYLAGDTGQASTACDSTLAHAAGHADAFNLKGVILLGQEIYDAAIVQFSQAIKNRPDHSEALYNRCVSYWKLGHQALALKDIDELIRLFPQSGEYYYFRAQMKKVMNGRDYCKDIKSARQLGYNIPPDVFEECR